ncbi:MAG: hypothetical protein ACXWGS_04010 [Solirubrobacterales bacterium]
MGELDALLLAKLAPALRCDLVGARHQTRVGRRGPLEQFLHPKPDRAAVGQLVVEGGVPAQQGTPFDWTPDGAHDSLRLG